MLGERDGHDNDSEEDSKLHRPVSLTGTPWSRPQSDSASVWAPDGDGGMSGNPGAVAAASQGRGRSGSNHGLWALTTLF